MPSDDINPVGNSQVPALLIILPGFEPHEAVWVAECSREILGRHIPPTIDMVQAVLGVDFPASL